MRRQHLDEGTLQALLDGELTPLATLHTRWHLARCAGCREALSAHRAAGTRAASLLSSLARPIDVEAGWRRVIGTHTASSGAGGHVPARSRSMHRLQWSAGIGVALLIAVVAVVHVGGWNSPMLGGAPSGNEQVRNVCCFDLDGGGPGDDGILTLSQPGERVECVVVYDDIDRTRTFSAGDRARYASSANGCDRAIPARMSAAQRLPIVASVRLLASADPGSARLTSRAEP